MSSFEILEHTADVGVRARAASLEGLFEQATYGLLEIIGALQPGDGRDVVIEVAARDVAAVLVDWLSEVLYVQDTQDAVVTRVDVTEVDSSRAVGSVGLRERSGTLEGTAVKAITYHQLKVVRDGSDWLAEFYVDV